MHSVDTQMSWNRLGGSIFTLLAIFFTGLTTSATLSVNSPILPLSSGYYGAILHAIETLHYMYCLEKIGMKHFELPTLSAHQIIKKTLALHHPDDSGKDLFIHQTYTESIRFIPLPNDSGEDLFVHESNIKTDIFQSLAKNKAITTTDADKTKYVDTITSEFNDHSGRYNTAASGRRRVTGCHKVFMTFKVAL